MANELRAYNATGKTLYAVLLSSVGQVWNGSTWEAVAGANWTTYDLALTEAAAGIYLATMPVVAAGMYSYAVYEQAGANPAVTDTLRGLGSLAWSGTAEVDQAALSVAITDILTVTAAAPSAADIADAVLDEAKGAHTGLLAKALPDVAAGASGGLPLRSHVDELQPLLLGRNLIENGGFEQFTGTADDDASDTFLRWQDSAGLAGDKCEASTTAYDGGYALKLTHGGVAGVANNVFGLISTPGARYRLTFYSRGDGSVAGRYQIVDFTHVADILPVTSTGNTTTIYVPVTYEFTVPDGCLLLDIYLHCPATAGSAYFDSVSLVEVGKSAQDVRDALKLAPSAGDPAAGSVDKHLDDILADMADGSDVSTITTAISGVAATLTAMKGAGWSTETLVAIDVLLDAIKAKTDLLAAAGVTVSSPASATGDVTVYQGDDYHNTDGRAIEWSNAAGTWPDLTSATVVFGVRAPNGSSFTATGSVVTPTGAGQKVRVELTATQTALLVDWPTPSELRVRATLASGRKVTLVDAELEAIVDIIG